MEDEKLKITCPLCREKHEYSINVDRSFVLYQMTSDMGTSLREIKQFKRAFVCPDKKTKFQAVIKMEYGFGEIINDVIVRESVVN
ncbi:hypothetical protein FHG08_11805 [Pseudoalteromonas sp. Scap03]|uniref:hypothetical protein n=1 Tax=unclassified Pseudoalteromonas TaxID=194690 RepID=UPI0015BBFACC|nr:MULTISPECIES: hypothetical protein [unclassified Pseudoalteromonas]NWL16376.1 hypothetical protein [Pseudoalteromonas sp. Scap03]QLE81492.1 hypothetical protein FLM54_08060 [Pseudoalteromonas sp. Scap25]QLE89436.1 hypothetical protein FLM47_08055 [Pseudoalteromonas sp. Scap06]|tara:strand:- start:188 stop:442 length:255 start_codon:yes stop_codon:yes gene_type:complete